MNEAPPVSVTLTRRDLEVIRDAGVRFIHVRTSRRLESRARAAGLRRSADAAVAEADAELARLAVLAKQTPGQQEVITMDRLMVEELTTGALAMEAILSIAPPADISAPGGSFAEGEYRNQLRATLGRLVHHLGWGPSDSMTP